MDENGNARGRKGRKSICLKVNLLSRQWTLAFQNRFSGLPGASCIFVSERACSMGIQAPSSQTCPTLSAPSLPWAVKPPNDRNAYDMESYDNKVSIFCFHDFEEGINWRNNLETLEMGVGEWEQKTRQKKRHLSLKSISFILPIYGGKHVLCFFLRQKWKKSNISHFLFLQD